MYFNPFIRRLYLYNSPPHTKKKRKKEGVCNCLQSSVVGCKMVQCIVRMYNLINEPILILLEVIPCTEESFILFAHS